MPKKIDYTNYENEYIKVICIAENEKQIELNKNNKNKFPYWKYTCKSCGNENAYVSSQNIKKITSCGCSRRKTMINVEKVIGEKYNRLTIESFNKERTYLEFNRGKRYGSFYNCKCECGKEVVTALRNLKSGHIKSCGCLKFNNPLIVEDLTGQKFNRFTVIERDVNRDKKEIKEKGCRSGNARWLCKCECGNIKSIGSWQLKSGGTKSCGCLISEMLVKRNKELSKKYNRPEKYKTNKLHKSTTNHNTMKIYDEEGVHYFLVDEEDCECISKWYWRKITEVEEKNCRKRYWITNAHKEDIKNGYPCNIRLHQVMAEIKYGKYDKKVLVPDHLNRNPDDNTKSNIILKTNSENAKNRGISCANTSGKTGVYKKGNKWNASITVEYNAIYLGSFNDFEDAVKARLEAEKKYGFTCDNIFPESAEHKQTK